MLRRSFLRSLAVPLAALVPAVARRGRPWFGPARPVLVPIKRYEFTETHVFAEDRIALGYDRVLLRLVGRRNDAPFKGIAAGACLLVAVRSPGVDVSTRTRPITFRFAVDPDAPRMSRYDSGDFSALGIGA
jgi:hypothetical protein